MNESAWLLIWSWPVLAALASALASAVHAAEEVLGEGGPISSYLGRIVGVRVPGLLGLLIVAGLLPTVLILVAGQAYLGGSSWWLSLLAGLRLGDAVFSHALPWLAGWRPNPGIWSSIYNLAEGGLILALAEVNWLPLLAGTDAFALVLPSLWLLGRRD